MLGIDDDKELEEYLGQLLDRSDYDHAGFISELIRRRKGVDQGPQNFTVSFLFKNFRIHTNKHRKHILHTHANT